MLLHIGVNVILCRSDPQLMVPDCKYYAEMAGKQKITSIKYKTKNPKFVRKIQMLDVDKRNLDC